MQIENIFVTGGAGYVGAILVPRLLDEGCRVTVLDLMIYGEDVLPEHPRLNVIKGDIRDQALLEQALRGHDAVIHLACISNDPSFELNPKLGKSINLDAFRPLVEISRRLGVARFIYASSSSVYGIKEQRDVHEGMTLEPLTDYSKYKAMCEDVLQEEKEDGFCTVTVRPSTVCGYAPRLRLDLTVNILTNHAINNRKITVFGGSQMRPNIHINDMVDAYLHLLNAPYDRVDGGVYNIGYQNLPVMRIAELVRDTVSADVDIEVTPSDDNRSYHVSSELMKKELGFVPRCTVEDAIRDLKTAFDTGLVPNSMSNSMYFNIRRMQEVDLV